MTLLDYASNHATEGRSRGRWIIAATVGLGVGLAGGRYGFEPMLHAVVGHERVTVGSKNQIIPAWMLFIMVAGISGIVVACSGLVAAGRRKMWFGWPILFAIVFSLGMSIGLLAAQARWNQERASFNHFSAYTFLPRRYLPHSSNTGFGFYVIYQVPNFIVLAPAACGCAAVICALAVIKMLHYLGRPRDMSA
jgi:hypothetical protein